MLLDILTRKREASGLRPGAFSFGAYYDYTFQTLYVVEKAVWQNV